MFEVKESGGVSFVFWWRGEERRRTHVADEVESGQDLVVVVCAVDG